MTRPSGPGRIIAITPLALHWVTDPPHSDDLCAHGGIRIAAGDDVLLEAEGDMAVSAGALYLLRSLEADHTPDAPLAERIIPCCGFEMAIDGDSGDVHLFDCLGVGGGANWWIRHNGDDVVLTFASRGEIVVSSREWSRAVADFADAVAAFFARSAGKRPTPDIEVVAGAYEAFWREWKRRRSAARTGD